MPSFVNQYRQRVGGRLEQVEQDLAPFQQIADRYHGGSLDALIQHHLRSSDPTFFAEGRAIQAMLDSSIRLREMLHSLDTDIAHQLLYLALHRDAGILRSTMEVYEPAFVMNTDGLIVALVFGLLAWLLFLGLWRMSAALVPGRLRAGRRQ